MKIIVNASNIHTGGGRVMLIDFLNSAKNFHNVIFIVYVDPRFDTTSYKAPNIEFYTVTLRERILVDYRIRRIASSTDIIICFGDIPPFIKHKTKVILLLSSRYLVENYTLTGLGLKTKLRLTLERCFFRYFSTNANWIIVHSFVMRDRLIQMGIPDAVAKVMPYKNKETVNLSKVQTIPNSFLYVASGEPHKNHKNLIYAWVNLAEEGIRPSLYLTIDRTMSIYKWIRALIVKHDLRIEFLEQLPREELFAYYKKVSALIYPSCLESFGFPLFEAQYFDLPILASELDYVRELVDPVETFDPHSHRSISRAVKRFLKHNEERREILTADDFIKEITSWTQN